MQKYEQLTKIIEECNPELRVEDKGSDSFLLKQNLSDYVNLSIELPQGFEGQTNINLSAPIGESTPEDIISAMQELIAFRNEVNKRDYIGTYRGTHETTDIVEYVYEISVANEQDVTKVIKDFDLLNAEEK